MNPDSLGRIQGVDVNAFNGLVCLGLRVAVEAGIK